MKGHGLNLALALGFSLLIWWAIGSHLTERNEVMIAEYRIVLPANDVIVRYEDQPSTGQVLVLPEQVRIVVQGPKEKVERVDQIQAQISITKEELDEAFEREVPYLLVDAKKGVRVPDPLEVVETIPSQLRLEVERVQHKMVWVEPGPTVGEPAAGFRAGEVTVNPRRVAVRGPESALKDTYQTQPIDLAGANGDFPVDLPLDCPPGIVAPTVRVTVSISPTLKQKKLEFPITIMRAHSSAQAMEPLPYRIQPRDGWRRYIELRGPLHVLDDLDSDLDRQRLSPSIDVKLPRAFVPAGELPTQLSKPEQEQDVRIELSGLPEGVEVVGSPSFPVTFIRVSK